MRQKPSRKKPFLWALLFSLLFIHLPLAVYLLRLVERTPSASLESSQHHIIKIDLKKWPLKIADIAPPENQTPPENPSAQSSYNSTVKEETVAPGLNQKTPPPSTPTLPAKPHLPSPPVSVAKSTSPATSHSTSPTTSTKPATSDLTQEFNQIRQQRESLEQQRLKDLFSSKSVKSLPTSLGGNPTRASGEFYPNYKVGHRTYLNALANPNVFYFVELRRKFRLAFNPLPALRANIGHLPKNKIEVVWGVGLDAKGQLIELVLLKSSGLASYDAEGRRTVSSSAPFTAPPADFLDKESRLNMAWTFTVFY